LLCEAFVNFFVNFLWKLCGRPHSIMGPLHCNKNGLDHRENGSVTYRAANLLTKDEAPRIAVNMAKLPHLLLGL
jgi:hypothetical protein